VWNEKYLYELCISLVIYTFNMMHSTFNIKLITVMEFSTF
jgi:hypothetical protein